MKNSRMIIVLFIFFFNSVFIYAQFLDGKFLQFEMTDSIKQINQLIKIQRLSSQPISNHENILSSSILDPTFGINGTVLTTIGGSKSTSAVGQSAVRQNDGKIVVAGYLSDNYNTSFAVVRYMADGVLDSLFGINGAVTTLFNGGVGKDFGYSAAIQSDGKIVVAGASFNNGQGSSFAVARYDTNGVLDNTFGGNGTVRIQINGVSGSDDKGSSVVIQPDGKIVVGGTSNSAFAVARLNANGTLDNTFGVNGTARTTIYGGDGTYDGSRAVAIQPDGKIVLAGSSYSFFGGGNAFAIARYDINGVIDSTFGGNGTIRLPVGGYGPNAIGSSIAIQSDGRIVVVGEFNNDDGEGYMLAVYRYNANGILDSSFGTNGIVKNKIDGGNAGEDKGFSVAMQPDGKIVVGGTSKSSIGYAFAAARYDTTGKLDSMFGTNGTVRISINDGDVTDDEATSVLMQQDGKIVMAGYSADSSISAFAVARLDTTGTIDSSFGLSGIVRTEINRGYGNDEARSVAIQTEGKIIVAGTSYVQNVIANSTIAIARYNTDGTLDKTFAFGGTTKTAINGGSGRDVGDAVAIQRDGKIIVAGGSYGTSGNAFAMARYNINGSLDNTFGTNGTVKTLINGDNGTGGYATSIAIQPDRKIVLAGGSGYAFAVARYNIDGTLDNTFGTNGTVRTFINGGDGSSDYANSVTIQSDGKIVAVGLSRNGGNNAIALARYKTNGVLDNTFGTNGTVRTLINDGDGTADIGYSVALQPDGKIIVGGRSKRNSTVGFAVVRYNSNGTLDNTFGNNGAVRTLINGSDGTADIGFSMALQMDGKIVVVGRSKDNTLYAFGIARYTPNGKLDNTFNLIGTGRIQMDGSVGADAGNEVALQSNGKIIAVGISRFFFGTATFAVARFLPGSTSYGSLLPPIVISHSVAQLSGIVYPFKNSTTVRFLYGKQPGVYTDSIEASPSVVNGDTITVVSTTLGDLSASTTYYFRLSGTGSAPGNYFLSDELSFTTLNTLTPPFAISPNGIMNVARKTTFVWNSSDFAKKYHIQVAPDSLFSYAVVDTTLADTSMTLSDPLETMTQYYWRVSAMDTTLNSSVYSSVAVFTTGTVLGITGETNKIPKDFALNQNYPNPFNPTTTIKYQLPVYSFVTLKIHDILGREVASLVNEWQNAGYYSVVFNGTDLSSGVYFYRFYNGYYNNTKKLLLLK